MRYISAKAKVRFRSSTLRLHRLFAVPNSTLSFSKGATFYCAYPRANIGSTWSHISCSSTNVLKWDLNIIFCRQRGVDEYACNYFISCSPFLLAPLFAWNSRTAPSLSFALAVHMDSKPRSSFELSSQRLHLRILFVLDTPTQRRSRPNCTKFNLQRCVPIQKKECRRTMVMYVYIENGCGVELGNRQMIQAVQRSSSRLPLITFLWICSIQIFKSVYHVITMELFVVLHSSIIEQLATYTD